MTYAVPVASNLSHSCFIVASDSSETRSLALASDRGRCRDTVVVGESSIYSPAESSTERVKLVVI